jgi:hypothetical protein
MIRHDFMEEIIMQILQPFGGVLNMAAAFANSQVFPKVMTLPVFLPLSAVSTAYLKNAGSPEMNVNGSVTPVVFEYVVASDKYFGIAEINIVISDGAITPTKFGGITALSNGILWQVVDASNTLVFDFCPGGSIKQNAEFANVGGSVIILTGGADQISITWHAATSGISAIIQNGWKLRITVRDDLTGLAYFRAAVTGVLTSSQVSYIV